MSAQIIRLPSMAKRIPFGVYMKAWRESKELTLKALGAKISVSDVHIVHIEQDKYDYPVGYLRKLKGLMTKKEYKEAKEILHAKLEEEME